MSRFQSVPDGSSPFRQLAQDQGQPAQSSSRWKRQEPRHGLQFDAKRSTWYSEAEVLNLKNGVAVRKGAIRLSNIQQNWMQDIIDMGYDARTENRGEIEIVSLPEDAITAFHLPPTQQFVRRSRMTLVYDSPICLWSSYYPLNLVEGEILEEMRRNVATDVVKRIKEVHGVFNHIRDTVVPGIVIENASYFRELFKLSTLVLSWPCFFLCHLIAAFLCLSSHSRELYNRHFVDYRTLDDPLAPAIFPIIFKLYSSAFLPPLCHFPSLSDKS
ncbi:MAG: hypothetical protein H0U76_00630 [Ktedonobacteraceae bacterium]|nr:hypothetical protein [Ktedonobacteraceae bacterium]